MATIIQYTLPQTTKICNRFDPFIFCNALHETIFHLDTIHLFQHRFGGDEEENYCGGYAKFMALKCMGKDAEAKEAAIAFLEDFGKWELAIEHYYDHFMARNAIVNTKSDFDQ